MVAAGEQFQAHVVTGSRESVREELRGADRDQLVLLAVEEEHRDLENMSSR